MDVKDIKKIIEMLSDTDVKEFQLDKDGSSIKVVRGGFDQQITYNQVPMNNQPQNFVQQLPSPQAAAENSAPQVKEETEDLSGLIPVTSPIVGTFYKRPSPDADSFVEVGTSVKKGKVLCIIEAMKLMNEIEAEVSGTIEKILLEDGQVVEFGETIFLIRPN